MINAKNNTKTAIVGNQTYLLICSKTVENKIYVESSESNNWDEDETHKNENNIPARITFNSNHTL